MPDPTLLSWSPTGLPVERHLHTMQGHIAEGRLVVVAAPGAGKSTLVPLAAANTTPASAGRVVLLEPRRIAARGTAERLAGLLGESVGHTVGLTMRGERRVSDATRVEVVTEAILTQRLRRDAELTDTGCVIFDEFHERNLHSDLGLAMVLEAAEVVRPDLSIVVMSATIDPTPIARLLGGGSAAEPAPVIEVPGRSFDITTHHHRRPPPARWAEAVAKATQSAMAETTGDVLVFAPGRREIDEVISALAPAVADQPVVELHSLHGGTRPAEQRALRAPDGPRRVVVATAIAETSITLPRVTAVVDGGLSRRATIDPASGFSSLITRHTTRFAADQRRGRAGRVQAGVCHRLWSAEEERRLDDETPPEIIEGDQQELAVILADWGDPDAAGLPLLDRPRLASLERAREALELVGLFDGSRLTEGGRSVARLPIHPRLGALLLAASGTDHEQTIERLVAILDDDRHPDTDDLDAELSRRRSDRTLDDRVAQLRRAMRNRSSPARPRPAKELATTSLATLLAATWPDRVAQRRPGNDHRFVLAGGGEVELHRSTRFGSSSFEYVVVADAGVVHRSDGVHTLIRRALPIDRDDVLTACVDHVRNEDVVEWDRRRGDVRAERQRRLGAVVFHAEPLTDVPVSAAAQALARGLELEGLELLEWGEADLDVRARLAWLHEQQPDHWPAMDDSALLHRLSSWLDLSAFRSRRDLSRVHPGRALLDALDWQQRSQLDELAPAERTPPGGRPKRIDYRSGRPVWSVRLQHLFGLAEHPTVGPHATPITIELLSPADRPAQTTNDLPGFWNGSYAAVRADLRGRYPKHAWPEDPLG